MDKLDAPTDREIINALRPLYGCLQTVCREVEALQLRACGVLGLPRRTERSSDFHRAWRNLFTVWCDETDGRFEFVSESDQFSLDYLLCNLILGKPFAIRFGRLNNGEIRRNRSRRQTGARACGLLSSEFLIQDFDDPEPSQIKQTTMAYSLADDRTEGGSPAWWIRRLVIGRETLNGFHELDQIAEFERPESVFGPEARVVYVPKAENRQRWRQEFTTAMGGAA